MKLLISAVGLVAVCWLAVWLLLNFGSRPVGMKDIWDFKVSVKDVGDKQRQVHIEGLINSSSYVFKDAAFSVKNGKLEIIIREEYTRAGYSGSFSVSHDVAGDFREAMLMPEGTVIWREQGKWLSRDPLGEGWDATLYSYVWNRPTGLVDPLGLWGGGVTAGASAGAGITAGSSAQSSAGAGGFYNQNTGGTTLGAYGSTGSTSGFPSETNTVAGENAGVGAGFFLTNAPCSKALGGPFQQWDLNFPLISFGFAESGGTWIFTATAGPALSTISFTSYTTTTNWTAQTSSFNNPSSAPPAPIPPPPPTVSTGGAS